MGCQPSALAGALHRLVGERGGACGDQLVVAELEVGHYFIQWLRPVVALFIFLFHDENLFLVLDSKSSSMRVLLTTTSYQDTPGDHHALLEGQGFDIHRESGPLPEKRMLELAGDFDAFLCGDDEITKAVLGQNGRLRQAIAAASETLAENAGKNTFLPYHPGAARYLREVGQQIPDKLVMA
jgi:hypothetical protein